MAKGTRMKNFEVRLQQTRVVIVECQNKMEQLELGTTRNQEEILALDCRVENAHTCLCFVRSGKMHDLWGPNADKS